MITIRRFFIDFWPSMLVLAVILYATLNSDPVGADEVMLFPHADKLIHAIMMGGLVGAMAFDCQRRDRSRRVLTPRFMWTLFGIVAVFGLCDELLQAAIDNGRGCEAADFVADLVGEVVAVFLAPPAIFTVLKLKF